MVFEDDLCASYVKSGILVPETEFLQLNDTILNMKDNILSINNKGYDLNL